MTRFPVGSKVRLKNANDGVWTFVSAILPAGKALWEYHLRSDADGSTRVVSGASEKMFAALYERVLPELPETFVITKRERIVVDRFVELAGQTFDANDLAELLSGVKNDDVQITDQRLGSALMTLGVLDSLGSQKWLTGASAGPKFEEFREKLQSALDALYEKEKA